MSNYWPWWAGAIALAFVTIFYTVSTARSFGVSSSWDRISNWREERRIERADEQFGNDRALIEALAAASAAEFGTQPAAPIATDTTRTQQSTAPAAENAAQPNLRPAPLVSQAAFLVSIFLGGMIAAITAGRFQLRWDMGDGFRDIVTGNPAMMVFLLFAGGVLVGFGTRLAGGCTSGHGLSGCGRLRPVSLVATAVFFGTAVVVSFLLWKVI